MTRYTIADKERIRPRRIYKNKVFEDTQTMLVFVLYYLKNNCLQESQAAMFGMNQPQVNGWIHLLKRILEKAVKNILITSMIKKVLYLSSACEGKAHDKSICDEEQIKFEVPVILWEDIGFIGLNSENAAVKRPIKQPRKRELDDQEKAFNRQISSKRVKVEHAIGQCKIFRIVKNEVRAFKDDFRDTCMLLACGLNNFKIDFIKT